MCELCVLLFRTSDERHRVVHVDELMRLEPVRERREEHQLLTHEAPMSAIPDNTATQQAPR